MNRRKPICYWTLQSLVSVMLLAGCTGFSPPQAEIANTYILDAQPAIKAAQVKRDLVLAVSLPRARPGFDTSRMAYLRQPHELDYFAANQWADTPARMLGPLLTQTLEQTGSFRSVVQAPDGVSADVRLETELIRLQHDFSTQPSRVQLTLRAQLIDVHSKRVLAVKLFDEVENAASADPYGGVTAANRALQRMLAQLADFCIDASDGR